MAIRVRVGPPTIVINMGNNFMVTNQDGQVTANTEQGLFFGDTRLVNSYQIFINGEKWVLLNASAVSHYASRHYFMSPVVRMEGGDLPKGQIGLTVTRMIGDGVHEDTDLVNYAMHPVSFTLETALRSDFADLFEVKSHHFYRRGQITTRWDQTKGELITRYSHKDFSRRLVYKVGESDCPPRYANGRVVFEVTLEPGQLWHSCQLFMFGEDEGMRRPPYTCGDIHGSETVFNHLLAEWRDSTTQFESSNADLARTFQQSVDDMAALRLHEHDLSPDEWVPAAGVPWFVTLFGRDTLIASLQNMIVHAPFAVGVLKKLAQYQAKDRDDWRDAQPGKIMHELRTGELAHFYQVPHTPYYGTADTTILYLITLHEAWKWLGDDRILRDYRDIAINCLGWIDKYGDLDGDGFQEYRTYSSDGYENMGWKDAGDAIVYPSGLQVRQPKALCEIQGYVFDAKNRMAEMFDRLGEAQRARALRQQASELQSRFNQAFWMEDEGFIALGLDSNKHQIKTLASNAGHCLWSGIVAEDRAEKVVQRLLEHDLSSGWGIRTLSSRNPAYNPYSYQSGSIWPHDNAIIISGFKRYGFYDEANRVARDVLDAASYFDSNRLPELYAGLPKQPGAFPVQHLGANVPQAWAAGSVFHMVKAILGLDADAPNGKLYVAPTLPAWLRELELSNLKVGDSVLRIRFWREGSQSRWEVLDQRGSIDVEDQPRAEYRGGPGA